MKATNQSEAEVVQLIEHCEETIIQNKLGGKALKLRCCGMNTMIAKEPINIMEVKVGFNTYTFGGISEAFYDQCVAHCDSLINEDED